MAPVPETHQASNLQSALQISIGTDLISNAKYLLAFLKKASNLQDESFLLQAIRRYKVYWLPLAARSQDLLPPFDVHWVWLCHCLNPKTYQRFCERHYSKIIDLPILNDTASEFSAHERCRLAWKERYPNEPFDIEMPEIKSPARHRRHVRQAHASYLPEEKELVEIVLQESRFYKKVSRPYMYHDGFLKVAEERYKCFLYMLFKHKGRINYMPTFDIQLMWKSHQIYPAMYILDISRLHGYPEEIDVQSQEEENTLHKIEHTSRTWEVLFGQPYERAGAMCRRTNIAGNVDSVDALPEIIPLSINWYHQTMDINSKHKSLTPRFIVEVCIHVKGAKAQAKLEAGAHELVLRLRMMEACKSLQQCVPVSSYMFDNVWHQAFLMQCEVSSNGLILELRSHRVACLKGVSQLLGKVALTWKELETEVLFAKKNSLSIKRTGIMESLITLTSITPPVQAPYLLKALNDRVTDDTGAMLSKRIGRLNKHKPQCGRWISWTVLDHTGNECFIIRICVAAGVWRKNERPVGVDWNERIIQVHGGGWNYIRRSVGIAPENILATATPVGDELEQYKMKWSLSTGETLTIQMPIENSQWERNLGFSVKGSSLGMVRLLNGRCMQYEVPCAAPEEEEGYVTLVRYTTESPQGQATALFNWKMSVMEILPEEDVVFVILICIATQRSVGDLGGKILHNLYKRRKVRQHLGKRDWGSVVMGEGKGAPPEYMRWYVNPEDVLGVNLADANNDEVLPKGASYQMYRGTSWLYGGSSKGLYNLPSKGSFESFGVDGSDHFFGLQHFGSQTKFPAFSR